MEKTLQEQIQEIKDQRAKKEKESLSMIVDSVPESTELAEKKKTKTGKQKAEK